MRFSGPKLSFGRRGPVVGLHGDESPLSATAVLRSLMTIRSSSRRMTWPWLDRSSAFKRPPLGGVPAPWEAAGEGLPFLVMGVKRFE